MAKRHLKALNAPQSWPLKRRKGVTFITRPVSGPHSLKTAIPINIILREIIGCAKTTKEVKRILHEGKLLINNIARKDHKFPVGLMDTISIPLANEYYRLIYNEYGKFVLKPIKKEEAKIKLCKIKNKKILKGKKIQLNLSDGTNILVPKDGYNAGDSLLIEDNKIKKHLKLEKNAKIFLTSGKYVGKQGTLEKVYEPSALTKTKILLKSGNKKLETLKDFAYVIDGDLIK